MGKNLKHVHGALFTSKRISDSEGQFVFPLNKESRLEISGGDQTSSSESVCACVHVCAQAKGFELSYLEKVVEVKDTVHRQSLLHHTCNLVVENYPESSDVYSEIPAITRSAKVQFSPSHLHAALM